MYGKRPFLDIGAAGLLTFNMMGDDLDYLVNYRDNELYQHPGQRGAYATIVGDSAETIIGEVEVTSKCRIAVSAFYVRDRADFGTLKITKLKHHATYGWRVDGEVKVNSFQLRQINDFLSIIGQLDLSDSQKTRVSLKDIHIGALGALLRSAQGPALVNKLAEAPELHTDIYAVAAKREAVAEFESLLVGQTAEREWQAFFERNPWVFGHGLNYVFLEGVANKLETTTTGSTFDQSGKRVDALMRTRAEISQFVLVEIKRADTSLLDQRDTYRPGCWGVSAELSNAVTQVQKTTYEFARGRFRERLRDRSGFDLNDTVYSIEPRSYLIAGNLEQLRGNDDQITCFELYRRNIRAPEIVTFDELFARARCIVENVSRKAAA